MFKKIIFLLFIFFWFINISFADNLWLSIEWWNTKNVFYAEEISINAIATFPEWCTSTWITWTETIPWFPFPSVITIWTWNSYSSAFTTNKNITVTANCDMAQVVNFLTINIKNPEIFAWINTSYNFWDLVNLSWNITWTPCSVFNYQWEQISWPTVEISNSWWLMINSTIYSDANFIFPNTTENIELKLKVSPESCFHAWNTYFWNVIYSKKIILTWWAWSSWTSRMKEEAKKIFYDTWSIEKIDLKLELEDESSKFMNFSWNNIGWEWQVQYILEYSTGSIFYNNTLFETTEQNYDFNEDSLDKESFVHFFRLKACYSWKCSKYSNILKYYIDDYLPLSCNKSKKFVNFDDIFFDVDLLIEKNFSIKCVNCKKK